MKYRADRAAHTARIAELESANRALTAENERLQSHLELAQALAHELITHRLAEGFTNDATAAADQLALQLRMQSLHRFGTSVIPARTPTNLVAGL